MAGQLLPDVVNRLLSNTGAPVSGGSVTFTRSGTSTAAAVYSDNALSTSLGSVVSTNSAGLFVSGSTLVSIYLDSSIRYKAVFKNAAGTILRTVDPVQVGGPSVVVNVKDFATAAAPCLGDGSDATACFLLAQAWVNARAGNASIYVPAGSYRLSQEIAVTTNYTNWFGDGPNVTQIIVTFQGCPFPLGNDNSSTIEQVGCTDMGFVAGVTQTSAQGLEVRACVRFFYRNIWLTGFYNFALVGSTNYGVTATPAPGEFHNCGGGVAKHGYIIPAFAAGLVISGGATVSGVRGANGRGFDITGALDGLFMQNEVAFSDFDTSVYIHHTSGSVASIELGGSFTTPSVYFVRVELSGTAELNHLLMIGTRLFDRTDGTGNADALFLANTGTGKVYEIVMRNVQVRDVRQRVVNLTAPVQTFVMDGVCSLRGSSKLTNTYDAVDLGSQAHQHVQITNCRLGGNVDTAVTHRYGINNALNTVKLLVNNVDASDAGTATTNNMGSTTTSRIISNVLA